MPTQKEEILTKLRARHGLVIADRQMGKTSALLERVKDIGTVNCVVVVPTHMDVDYITRLWQAMGGLSTLNIVPVRDLERSLQGRQGMTTAQIKILVDDWYRCGCPLDFFEAVTTFPFPVTTIEDRG